MKESLYRSGSESGTILNRISASRISGGERRTGFAAERRRPDLAPRSGRRVPGALDVHDFRQGQVPRDADGAGMGWACRCPGALDFPGRRSVPRNVQGDLSMDDLRNAVSLLRDLLLRDLPSSLSSP